MPVLTVVQGQTHKTISFDGQPVLGELLARHGFGVQQPCGGRGTCGKCSVCVSGCVSQPTEAERAAGVRLACQTVLLGDCCVELSSTEYMAIQTKGSPLKLSTEDRRPMPGVYGAAVDIGTTTVVVRLYRLQGGAEAAQAAALNPQTQVAADVIGRIQASLNGRGAMLREAVAQAVQKLLRSACADTGIGEEQVLAVAITGNTAMLYLLMNISPESLAHAPFHADRLFGERHVWQGKQVYFPPCMTAFVGADLTCAVLASGMCSRRETALLMDIGTNGETALWHEGRLYITSTAAGPAFEGVGISCGCGSVAGAVDKVSLEGTKLCAHTIGEAPAVGICGSGLVDAVAAMLQLGWIDESGAMDRPKATVCGQVTVSARDIRSLQLAKGAMAAGVYTLLESVGLEVEAVATVYIAGGFGHHLNMRSAAAIGLIPWNWVEKTRSIGNAALTGAAMLLLDQRNISLAEEIAHKATPVLLGGNAAFSEWYMACMAFGEAKRL